MYITSLDQPTVEQQIKRTASGSVCNKTTMGEKMKKIQGQRANELQHAPEDKGEKSIRK